MRDIRLGFLALLAYLAAASACREIAPLATLVAVSAAVVLTAPRGARALAALPLLLPGLLGIPLLATLESGFLAGAESFLKLLALAVGPVAFFLQYDARELERLLLHIRVPATLAFAFTAALSFIPLVGEEIARVYDAERERGIPVDTPKGLVLNLGSFMTPILLACFRLAEELAETLIARGLACRRVRDRSWSALSGDLETDE